MKVAGIIFSNIYDKAFGELTRNRTVASLPFGGRYRQIDFALSNMVNSGITHIGLITKYNYQSLMDHLGNCAEWDLDRKNGGLFILPPFLTGQTSIYRGKLEALSVALSFFSKIDHDYIVMMDSTTLCNIDLEEYVEQHVESGCDITVISSKVSADPAIKYDLLLKSDSTMKAVDAVVKSCADDDMYAGLGIFIIGRKQLIKVIEDSAAHGKHHFEREYILEEFNKNNISINICEFSGVALRNMDVLSYFRNSLSLFDKNIRADIFKSETPIYTKVRDEAPTFYSDKSCVSDCVIADGCQICGTAQHSIVFRNVKIGAGAKITNSIIMQGTNIGKNVTLENAIIDKDVTITEGTKLIGAISSPIIVRKGETI